MLTPAADFHLGNQQLTAALVATVPSMTCVTRRSRHFWSSCQRVSATSNKWNGLARACRTPLAMLLGIGQPLTATFVACASPDHIADRCALLDLRLVGRQLGEVPRGIVLSVQTQQLQGADDQMHRSLQKRADATFWQCIWPLLMRRSDSTPQPSCPR